MPTRLIDCFLGLQNNGFKFKMMPLIIRGILYDQARVYPYRFLFENNFYEFICIIYSDNPKVPKGIAYLNNISEYNKEYNIITESDEYRPPDYLDAYETIDVMQKLYCAEIMDYTYDNKDIVLLNWLQNKSTCDIPNIEGTACRGLGGLLRLIFAFLQNINFNGSLYLDDDSMFQGIKTLVPRLLTGKQSIYYTYGFRISKKINFNINEIIHRLANTHINGAKVIDLVHKNIQNGIFKPSMAQLINILVTHPSTQEYYHQLTRAHEKMKLSEINKQMTLC